MRLPESAKPQTIARRLLQGFLPLDGAGIDVGSGRREFEQAAREWWQRVPGMRHCSVREWDVEDGDAHDLASIPDHTFSWLFSSHCLEHLADPDRALLNWLRVVGVGGHLLLSVPHRQLYEQRHSLPSRWNPDHRRFYLPFNGDGPDTVGVMEWLAPLQEPMGFCILNLATGDWGHTNTGQGERIHPDGEFCIDVLLRKWA